MTRHTLAHAKVTVRSLHSSVVEAKSLLEVVPVCATGTILSVLQDSYVFPFRQSRLSPCVHAAFSAVGGVGSCASARFIQQIA